MARIRTIKPMFWTDESLVKLPFEYRLLFIGIWNHADDDGFIENKPLQIKLQIFPADDVDVAAGIRALVKAQCLESVTLDMDGKRRKVLRIKGWKNHQVISRPTPSRFAPAYAIYQGKRSTHGGLTEDSRRTRGGLHREGKGREGKGREDTQVGGGGNVSSGEPEPPPPPIEPWRCKDHQGIDVPCLACKAAKDKHKAGEAQRKRDETQVKRDAENTRRQAALAERNEAEREALRDPVQIHALIESALHPKEVDA
jgi:hypothetical protein